MTTLNAGQVLNVGQVPLITATCRDIDGTLANPASITFYVDTNGLELTYTQVSPEVTNPSVGIWKCQLPAIDRSARHQIRVKGTGAVADVAQTSFDVRPVNALVSGQIIS